MPKSDKQKMYKLPKRVIRKQHAKKAMKNETMVMLKVKVCDHNAKVKGYLHVKLGQKKADLFRDLTIKVPKRHGACREAEICTALHKVQGRHRRAVEIQMILKGSKK